MHRLCSLITAVAFLAGFLLLPALPAGAIQAPYVKGSSVDGSMPVPVDAQIFMGFSGELDPATVNGSTITVVDNGSSQAVPGTVTYYVDSPDTGPPHAVFQPLQPFLPNTLYTLTVSTAVYDSTHFLPLDQDPSLPGNQPYVRSFTTAGVSGMNTTPPMVLGTLPFQGAFAVPTNARKFFVKFNQPLDGSTVNAGTIFLKKADSPDPNLAASVAYDVYAGAAQLILDTSVQHLDPSCDYLLNVGSGIMSATGIPLAAPYQARFTTAGGPDGTAPTVLGADPADGSQNVPPNIPAVTVGFSEGMDPTTVGPATVTLTGPGVPPYDVEYDPFARAAHIILHGLLPLNTQCTINVIGAKDLAGNALVGFSSSFTTAASFSDTAPPAALFANADQFGLALTFSEPVQAAPSQDVAGFVYSARNQANYTLYCPYDPNLQDSVQSAVYLAGKDFQYDPLAQTVQIHGLALIPGAKFKMVARNVKDLAGNPIDVTKNAVVGSVADSSATGGMLGPGAAPPPPPLPGGMNLPPSGPANTTAGALTDYHFSLFLYHALPAGSSIMLTFPAGFDVSGAALPDPPPPPNLDVNGPAPGTVTFASLTTDATARAITLVTAGGSTNNNDLLDFVIKGIRNSSIPQSFGSSGYTVDVKTVSSGALVESFTSPPFFITAAGANKVQGTVTTDGGTPLNGVKVFLGSPMTGPVTATSDVNGTFVFDKLPDGQYFLFTEPAVNVGGTDYIGQPKPQPLNLSGGQTVTPAITLQSTAGLSKISVTVNGGTPGEQVDVFAAGPQGFRVKTLTIGGSGAATGELAVGNGAWDVGVGPALPKDPSLMTGPPPATNWMPPPHVQVQVSGGSVPVSFTLITADKTISGLVKDQTGAGIANAEVHAYNPTGMGMGAHTQTMSDGSFTLKVTRGTYTVGAFAPGLPPLPEKTVTVGDSSVSGIILTADKAGYTISGQVTDGTRVIKYAPVWAHRTDGPGMANTMTDTNGKYTLYVGAGTWLVEAADPPPGMGYLGSKSFTVSDANPDQVWNIAPGNNFGTISGTVIKDGAGVPGVMIGCEGINGTKGGNGTVTGSDGGYTVRVPYGTYRIHAWAPGMGELPVLDSVTVDTSNPSRTGQNFTVATATVTVTLKSGTAPVDVAEALVDAWNDTTKMGNHAAIRNGSGASFSVPVGTGYKVRVFVPGVGELPTQTVDLNAGSTSLDFQLPALSTLTGKVSDTSGAGIADAWVFAGNPGTGVGSGTATDASGNYTLKVPAGTYLIGANKPGYLGTPPAETVVSGPTGKDFTLSALGSLTISGQVTKDGAGVAYAHVWATSDSGGWSGASTDPQGNYTLSAAAGRWTLNAAGEGATGGPLQVTVGTSNLTGQNIALTAIAGYTIKPPAVEPVVPANGATIEDQGLQVKLILPPNSLGSGTNAGQVTVKETTAVAETSSARPLGGKGKQIRAMDSDGTAITNLNTTITVEISYNDEYNNGLISDADLDKLQLAYWDDTVNNWVNIPSTNDKVNHVLRGTVNHLTTFAPVLPTLPVTPDGLAAAAAGAGQIDLSWGAVTGATGYNLYRDTSSSGSFATMVNTTPITAASYSDTGLSTGTTYYYKVSAVNAYGESAKSGAVSATTSSAVSGSGSGPATPPVPANPATVSQTVTAAAGGTVKTTDGAATVIVPAGALSGNGTVSITGVTGAGVPATGSLTLGGKVFDIAVTGATLTGPVTLTFKYDATSFTGVTAHQIGLYYYHDGRGSWIYAGGDVDTATGEVTAQVNHFTKFAVMANPALPALKDLGGHWAKNDIRRLVGLLAVSGYPDGAFKPDNSITRAEFATILAKAMGWPADAGAVKFADAPAIPAWAKGYVGAAVARGVISGYEDNTFRAGRLISRDEIAVMVVKALGRGASGKALSFADTAVVPSWAAGYVATAVDAGIVRGLPGNVFAPANNATRAESATMIARLLNVLKI